MRTSTTAVERWFLLVYCYAGITGAKEPPGLAIHRQGKPHGANDISKMLTRVRSRTAAIVVHVTSNMRRR